MSRKRLRGGFLHSRLGDRLLDKSLWRASPGSLARAWLVGFPISVIPFMPFQSFFAAIAGYLVRGNLIFCIALQFLSSPLTAPVHLPACYLVGEFARGHDVFGVWDRIKGAPLHLASMDTAFSLYLGAAIIGIIGGAAGYGIFQYIGRLTHSSDSRPSLPKPGSEEDRPAA